jgi:phage terminase small subunit
MVAHRVPIETLELRGAYDPAHGHPKRKRPPSPKSAAAIGAPPAKLSKDEKDIWHEVIAKAPAGVLTLPDGFMLETLCHLIALMRDHIISDNQRGQLIKLLSLLGFTPADRSRITAVETKDHTDPFAKFIN